MKTANRESGVEVHVSEVPLGVGSWTILIVLFLLLAVTFVIVYLGWTLGRSADVPASGYVAMALGVIVSLAVGFGLMALVFYSSRKGYDEPPVLIAPDRDGHGIRRCFRGKEMTDRTWSLRIGGSQPCRRRAIRSASDREGLSHSQAPPLSRLPGPLGDGSFGTFGGRSSFRVRLKGDGW